MDIVKDLIEPTLARPMMQPVEYYGCVQCQAYHFSDTEPEIYKQHWFWQEKHGTKLLYETMEERRERYAKHQANHS